MIAVITLASLGPSSITVHQLSAAATAKLTLVTRRILAMIRGDLMNLERTIPMSTCLVPWIWLQLDRRVQRHGAFIDPHVLVRRGVPPPTTPPTPS